VSVVLPTFNRAHLVGRAIASVLAQTAEDLELLVADDGSNDGTADVLAAVRDPRIRRLRLDVNGGVSRARNAAIAVAGGAWVAFLDDDNEWAPTYLARQLALAVSRRDAGVVYCRARRHDDRTNRDVGIAPVVARERAVFCDVVNGWNPPVSCTMVRRSTLVAAGGFDERLRVAEDLDLWLRLAQATCIAGTPDTLVVRHERTGAQLSANARWYEGAFAVLDRRWRSVIEATCGRRGYCRWRARFELAGVRGAVENGHRVEAGRRAGRMSSLLPWSAPILGRCLVLLAIGARGYDRLAMLRRGRGGH
jgi:glycosyltransferase involved in cell wall biosynthesis